MHIAQGVMKVLNMNKLAKACCCFKFWIADWFALLNKKMNGDLKKIQTVGRYMIEVWKAAGMDLSQVEFLWSSEEISTRAGEYWPLVMDIAGRNKLRRIVRYCPIMGRKGGDEMSAGRSFILVCNARISSTSKRIYVNWETTRLGLMCWPQSTATKSRGSSSRSSSRTTCFLVYWPVKRRCQRVTLTRLFSWKTTSMK